MRRYSNRQTLVTLSDINITPLLDLAFVLLIIFIIATPMIKPEQGLSLKLPGGGTADTLGKEQVRTVDIGLSGQFLLDGEEMELEQMGASLSRAMQRDPEMVVYIRTDREGRNKHTMAVVDECLSRGITRVSFRTEPGGRP